MFLIEYSKYFESKGFVRLKDVERHSSSQQSSSLAKSDKQTLETMSENLHSIKWIQQDGFICLTIHLEEIYLHARLGYCTRYRTNVPRAFLNEVIRFLTEVY